MVFCLYNSVCRIKISADHDAAAADYDDDDSDYDAAGWLQTDQSAGRRLCLWRRECELSVPLQSDSLGCVALRPLNGA